jgi:hypothetical protein
MLQADQSLHHSLSEDRAFDRRQERVAESAAIVADLDGDLYRRLSTTTLSGDRPHILLISRGNFCDPSYLRWRSPIRLTPGSSILLSA